jgi:DNA polymerase III epsilon subunit-like protein
MILLVDTETSGLPDASLPITHPSQPRVVQLAAYLAADEADGTLRHVSSLNAVIRPNGWEVGASALRVHGITTEYALAFGEPLSDVVARLIDLLTRADELSGAGRLVAHNATFDTRMLLAELQHCGADVTLLGALRPFCTMRALTTRMKLPGRHPGQYKWPNLDEAYRFTFGADVPTETGARHTAMTDLLACRDIFIRGRANGWWT